MDTSRPAASSSTVIDALVLAYSHSGIRDLIGINTFRDMLEVQYSELPANGSLDLEPVWQLLEHQSGFDAAAAGAAMCRVKLWEPLLGMPVALPGALAHLGAADIVLHAASCPVPSTATQLVFRESGPHQRPRSSSPDALAGIPRSERASTIPPDARARAATNPPVEGSARAATNPPVEARVRAATNPPVEGSARAATNPPVEARVRAATNPPVEGSARAATNPPLAVRIKPTTIPPDAHVRPSTIPPDDRSRRTTLPPEERSGRFSLPPEERSGRFHTSPEERRRRTTLQPKPGTRSSSATPAVEPPSRRRTMIQLAAAVVAVSTFSFAGVSLYRGCRPSANWTEVALDFAGGLPIARAERIGDQVRGVLSNESWLEQPEEQRNTALEQALRALEPKGVTVLFLEDGRGQVRATAQLYAEGTKIRFIHR